MKSKICKNPVISGVLINLLAMFLGIYAVKYSITPLFFMMVPVGVMNRKILDNGVGMDKKKKAVIEASFLLMLGVFLFYAFHINNVRNNQIMNM